MLIILPIYFYFLSAESPSIPDDILPNYPIGANGAYVVDEDEDIFEYQEFEATKI
jgi:hypothetical protein